MKARDAAELQTILDSDLAWRRREMSALVTLSGSVPAGSRQAVVRAAVPLLYAHWEGFGKECAVRYLEFVSYRRLAYKDLQPSFLYLKIGPSFKGFGTGDVASAIQSLNLLQSIREEKNKDGFRKRVTTRSNLRYEVLVELLATCGLDSKPFETYAEFIDGELCDPRNEIAHGVGVAPLMVDFVRRRNRAFELMTLLQTSIVNAAVAGAYKARPRR